MPRAYIRLDPEFADRKESYPDGAFVALVILLCAASEVTRRGTFKNEKLVRVLLGKRARWLRFLVANGDLLVQNDGTFYIDGWEEWQEGNWKVNERMQRVREKRRNSDRNRCDGANRNSAVNSDTMTMTKPRATRAREGDGSKDRKTTRPEPVGDVLGRVVKR